MKKFLIFVFIPFNLFAQNEPYQDSILKANDVMAISIVMEYIGNDSLSRIDTLSEVLLINENGKILQEKYSVGTKVLHKYFYDHNQRLIKEVRLTPAFKSQKNEALNLYTDTMTVINYVHNLQGEVAFCTKTDDWFLFKGTVKFEYNSKGKLVSKFEIDSAGNINDFEIRKYMSNGSIVYSVYNHEQMTSQTLYDYESDKIIGSYSKTRTFNNNGTYTLAYYNLKKGNVLKQEVFGSDNSPISQIEYIYDSRGLLIKSKHYKYIGEEKAKTLILIKNFIYKNRG